MQRDALIARHRNPFGLALRVATFLALAASLWAHQPLAALACLGIELANWRLMPPWRGPLPIIDRVIDIELAFLAAPAGPAKTTALALLALAAILLVIGLWSHALPLLLAGLAAMAGFGLTMHRLATPPTP